MFHRSPVSVKSAALAIICGCLTVVYAQERAKFQPPDGSILFFAGQSNKAIDEYVKTTGVRPSGFMLYTSIQYAEGLYYSKDYGSGATFGLYLLQKYPRTAVQLGVYMVDALDAIVAGDYDKNIDLIGRWIKESRRPVFLRIGYEFDGPHNHYEPEEYVKAYRYIADRFRKNNITNIAYVWHSYAAKVDRPLTDWYPGDEYVDWFGISYFGQHQSMMKPMVALAKEHGKPVMIGEASPAGIGTTKGEKSWRSWFMHYFDFIEKNDIKAFCYINFDWDNLPLFVELNWKDCRLGSNKTVAALWTEEISKEKYLRSSENLFRQLGYTPE